MWSVSLSIVPMGTSNEESTGMGMDLLCDSGGCVPDWYCNFPNMAGVGSVLWVADWNGYHHMGLSRCGASMIKNCDEVLEYLKRMYNELDYHEHMAQGVLVVAQDLRALLVKNGVQFNTHTGDAI
jgi:hypothetical protein